MGRHTGPKCKLCRAEGGKLFLKGERCNGGKCAFAKRAYRPGQHGQAQKRMSEFALRLREKQKAKSIFGLSEKQFRNYFEAASISKSSTGEKLLELVERRLDNVVFRLSMASSRQEARQLVRNGHVKVNGKKVNIPSFCVKLNNSIGIKDKSKERIKLTSEKLAEKPVPSWLSLDRENLEGSVVAYPKREEMDTLIAENLIVEFYSR
ncbi:MAG: 30S ribosomal protein S4 [Candidatus Margulisiibacteriota bacterium]